MIPVMYYSYDPAHSLNLIILKRTTCMGNGRKWWMPEWYLAYSMGIKCIGGSESVYWIGGLWASKTGSRCMETTIRRAISSPSASVNNPRLAYIWMYVGWLVHRVTYRDIWVRRVIIIRDTRYDSRYDACYGLPLCTLVMPVICSCYDHFATLILYAWITVAWDKGI